MNEPLLDEHLLGEETALEARKAPIWIIIFSWLFLLMGVAIPAVIVYRILGEGSSLALYGFASNDAFSLIGFLIILLVALKTVTAYGIITRKLWAYRLAEIDAILGIVLCVLSMGVGVYQNQSFTFRLEVILLIPYLQTVRKLQEPLRDI